MAQYAISQLLPSKKEEYQGCLECEICGADLQNQEVFLLDEGNFAAIFVCKQDEADGPWLDLVMAGDMEY